MDNDFEWINKKYSEIRADLDELAAQWHARPKLLNAKSAKPYYSIGQAARLVGRTPESIRDAENKNLVKPPALDQKTGRRIGYTLEQINHLRAHFKTFPHRDPADPPAVINLHNLSSGIGKSCICTHLAHGLAIQGYRVLVIDANPEATTTAVFGFVPVLEVGYMDTIAPALAGECDSLVPLARRTVIDQVDLIPSSYSPHAATSIFSAHLPERVAIQRMSDQVGELAANYDVVLIDSAPTQDASFVPLLFSSNALLVPHPPSGPRVLPTLRSLMMLGDRVAARHSSDVRLHFNWILGLVNESSAKDAGMQASCPDHCNVPLQTMRTQIRYNRKIGEAFDNFSTVFSNANPSRSDKTLCSAISNLWAMTRDIERQVHHTWPTRLAVLRESGHIQHY
ncbi:AAA family ATPase [Spiribacter sp. 218]|uniref:AAA family ATPase n=1 Tax=Spiribacter pallidus TaxID=1987936 RepID=UPI00349FAA39